MSSICLLIINEIVSGSFAFGYCALRCFGYIAFIVNDLIGNCFFIYAF